MLQIVIRLLNFPFLKFPGNFFFSCVHLRLATAEILTVLIFHPWQS